MSHHGENPFENEAIAKFQDQLAVVNQEEIMNQLRTQIKSGEISDEYAKEYPAGKLTQNDEGVIAFRITNHKERVIIDFGKPVHWFGLTAKEAKGLIDLLQKHIDRVVVFKKRTQTF